MRALSLRSQILIAVLLALLVAQGVAVWIAISARQEAVRTARMGDALERIAALVFVLERTPSDLHPSLLRAVETPLVALTIDAEPALEAPSLRLERLARRLRAELGDGGHDVRVAVIDTAAPATVPPEGGAASGPGTAPSSGAAPRSTHPAASYAPADPAPDRTPADRTPADRASVAHGTSPHHSAHAPRMLPRPKGAAGDSRRLMISLSLAPEGWLNASIRFPRPEARLPAMSLASFALSAAAVVVALWFALSRLVGPLRGLARAAERLGRGEEVGDLPVAGPAEMRALTLAFNQMQTRLHRMVSDRTQMLAALGHDLRSPLTALRVEAEMVDDDEMRARFLTSLAEMQDMVEQTLTYARGVWTREPVETVDAATLVAELVEAEDPPIPFARPAGMVLLRLRPATIRRALRNLIDNAQRYGGEVSITLRRAGDSVRIEIADRGPGIAADKLAQVFDPFVRIEESRSRETGGTGLGLAIARSIAQAHGGDVTLANRDGGGLIAALILPRPHGGDGAAAMAGPGGPAA